MKKIKYSSVLLIGIFVYIIFQFTVLFLGNNTETLVLKNEKLEVNLKSKGIVIRDEILIKAKYNGNIEILANEGERVKKEEIIANIYKDNKIDKVNKEIEELNSEIKKLESKNKNSNKLTEAMNTKNIETKKEQVKILNNQKKNSTHKIHSNIPGVISYKFDGKEDEYTLDKLLNLSKEDIESAKNNYNYVEESNIGEDDIVARIINNHYMYVAINTNKEKESLFEEGQSIILKFNNEKVNASVYKKYKKNEDYMIIFKISEQNMAIIDTRVEEFDIIYKNLEGLKIPKESIEVVDKKQGVYVVNEQTNDIEFKELQGIAYEDENYIYIDYYNNKLNNIKTVNLYDKIILKPNNINKHIKIK